MANPLEIRGVSFLEEGGAMHDHVHPSRRLGQPAPRADIPQIYLNALRDGRARLPRVRTNVVPAIKQLPYHVAA
jgi:hypothetical protein